MKIKKIFTFSSNYDSGGSSGPIGGHSWLQIENVAYGVATYGFVIATV